MCGGRGWARFGSSSVFCNEWLFLCSCVRSSMRFLNLWLQIALEWLHECCMLCVVGRKPEHETLFFRVKWVQPAMKGTSVCAAVAAGVVLVPPLCSATSGCSCVPVCVVLCVS